MTALISGSNAGTKMLMIHADSGNSTTEVQAGIGFSNHGGNSWASQSIGSLRRGGNGFGDLLFMLRNDTTTNDVSTADEKMRITAEGNVGIGITNPSDKLHINNGSLRIFSGDNSDQIRLIRNGTYTIGLGAEATPNLLLQGGNVGIGTTSPIQPLQVDRITGASTLNTTGIDQQHAVMVLNHQGLASARKDAGIMFMGNGSGASNISYASGMIKSGWTDTNSTNWNAGYIDFQTHGNNNSDWTTDMRIRGGNVGIGTTAPSRLLHLSGVSQYIRIQDTQGAGKNALIGQDVNAFNIWTNTNTITDSGWSERISITNTNGNI
jgi:hypothetical protein